MIEPQNERADEARIEALLKEAGARIAPPEKLMNDVRAAVHDDWRALVAERRRRRTRWLAAAASVGAIALVATMTIVTTTDATEMAVAMRVEGLVMRDAGLLHAARALSADSRVYVGDQVTTGPDGRVAFVAADGVELRIDAGSQVRLTDANRVLLERGAVYVDSDRIPDGRITAGFAIATDRATVRHIGTQYQVRTTADGIRVGVREGRVVVDAEGVLHEGRAGEQLAVMEGGSIARTALAADDPQWQWIDSIAPAFDIENRSLRELIEWFSRETGRHVAFATPQLAKEAETTVLRGSIEGLEPRAALDAVLATSNLVLGETNAGELIVQARE